MNNSSVLDASVSNKKVTTPKLTQINQFVASNYSAQVYREKQQAYEEGQPFKSLYLVKSGLFKSTTLNSHGSQKVMNFYFPGDLFGLDSIHQGRYQSNTQAVVTSSLYEIDYETFLNDMHSFGDLSHCFSEILSRELEYSKYLELEESAGRRLARFILRISDKQVALGFSASKLQLFMPRMDIASHLNMSSETVSRLFKRLQTEGLITIDKRDLKIIDLDALKSY